MNKRKVLSLSVAGLFAILFIAFAWVYINGLTSISQSSKTKSVSVNDVPKLFKNVGEGQIVLRRYKNQAVWLLHLNKDQLQEVSQLNDYVIDQDAGCDLSRPFCVLSASTSRDGINLHYTDQEPPQLLNGTPWYGGYVDPTTGSIYDFVGRAYKQNKNQSVISVKTIDLAHPG